METNIISQVAQKVFFKNAKVPEELQAAGEPNAVGDQVTLSKEAVAYIKSSEGSSEFENARELQLQRIKSLVNSGHYRLDRDVIDQIAEKIVNSLF